MGSCFKLVLLPLSTAVLGMAAGPDGPQRITSMIQTSTIQTSMIHTSTIHPDFRTGKLVRSVIVTAKPVSGQRIAETIVLPRVVSNAVAAVAAVEDPQPMSSGIDGAVERIAAQHSLPPLLIHSVIKVESNYNPLAVSPKGAMGLMQLIPSTARRFGVSDSFNPLENIQGGAKYLKYLLDLYNWNYPLALAAYNAGEGAVAKYGGVPPYAETRNYLVLIQKRLEDAQKVAAAKQRVQETKAADLSPTAPAHIQEMTQPDGTVRYVTR
jgi:hypothetical protein